MQITRHRKKSILKRDFKSKNRFKNNASPMRDTISILVKITTNNQWIDSVLKYEEVRIKYDLKKCLDNIKTNG